MCDGYRCAMALACILAGCGGGGTRSGPDSDDPAPRVNYFSWDCEAPHPYLNGYFPNTSIVTAGCHSGTHCMQINVMGNDGGNQSAGARIGTEIRLGPVVQGKWYYYRWWMKLDSAFRWGNGTGYAKAFRVKRTDEAQPGVWTGYIGKQGFFMHEMHGGGASGTEDGPNWWDANGPYVPYDLQAAAGTGWHEYIVAIRTQSGVAVSDGIFQAYVDGVFLGERRNQHFLGHDADCTEAWNGAMLQPYFQLNGTETDGGSIWMDDYSMDSDWNSLAYPRP